MKANIHDVHSPALANNKDAWMKACKVSKDSLVMHFSHYSCKIAEFCHFKRGAVLNDWLEDWKAHCMENSSEE